MLAAALVAAALLPQTADRPVVYVPAPRNLDAEACTMLRDAASKMQSDLPLMADKITRTDGFSVVCSARSVAWNKTMLIDLSN